MKKFKILISTYHGAFLNPGGGEVELLKISRSLKAFGVDVDIYGAGSKTLNNYDAVLHFGVNGDGLDFAQSVKEAKKPLILWPNLWWHNNQNAHNASVASKFFEIADKAIFKSYAELNNNKKLCVIDSKKTVVIPAGVEDRFFEISYDQGENFKRLYSLKNYLLWIGVIQRHKNQLELIKSMKETGLPIVFIGNGIDKEYYFECMNACENNIFIPNLSSDSDILTGALSGCSMFIELSTEPAGLSALEAGAAGRKILLLNNEWTSEQFGRYVTTLEHLDDHALIRDTVEKSLADSFDGADLSHVIGKNHSLSKITEMLIDALKS
jgi:glycosyltransferase involved in cell wall biosynthesis